MDVNALLSGNKELFLGAMTLVTAITVGITNYILNFRPNNKIKSLEETINKGFSSNSEEHKGICETLSQHWDIIKYYSNERNVFHRINSLAKSALVYCNSTILGQVMEVFTVKITNFMNEVFAIGFENITKSQISTKLLTLRSNIINNMPDEQSKLECSKRLFAEDSKFKKYCSDILDIYEDYVNDKNKRFMVKTEDYVQTFYRILVTEYNTQKEEK